MRRLSLISLFFIGWACQPKDAPYSAAFFPEEPVNLFVLNSEYDDMNSDFSPTAIDQEFEFIFSSKRRTKGVDFNFESRYLKFVWNTETGSLSAVSRIDDLAAIPNLSRQIDMLNTECNENGPYSFFAKEGESTKRFFAFSMDCEGAHKIMAYDYNNPKGLNDIGASGLRLKLFSETSNEMYPSFYGNGFLKDQSAGNAALPEKMVFTSDVAGNFDIYEISVEGTVDYFNFPTSDEPRDIQQISVLNSPSNDHCPFVFRDMLVFTSDRPGGYGGYDLYYSKYSSGKWSEPVNFGPKINSAFDEFRPILANEVDNGFENRLMIFSSNRPGGLGGFDLYYVGIPKN